MKNNNSKNSKEKEKNKKDKQEVETTNLTVTNTGEEVAIYYGFEITPHKDTKNINIKSLKDLTANKDESEFVQGRLALLESRIQEKGESFVNPKQFFIKTNPKNSDEYANLDIIGNNRSIAEAIMIKTIIEILREEGYKNLLVRINSVGDKDSISAWSKESINYLKKNLDNLGVRGREVFKENWQELFKQNDKNIKNILSHMSPSISYLSYDSKIYFEEILEYLEKLEIPYIIKNNLIPNTSFSNGAIFEIAEDNEDPDSTVLAFGYRYDSLSKKAGLKKEVSCLGAKICVERKDFKEKKLKEPLVAFLQLGFEARLYSLQIIDMLRKSKIPCYQILSKDKLSGQMTAIERLKIPFTILMGKKEAMENSCIVRNTFTRAQDTVKIVDLVVYLKKFMKEN